MGAVGFCLLLACLLVAPAALQAAAAVPTAPAEHKQPPLATVPAPGQRCATEVPLPPGLELTDAERELLPFICWPEEGAEEAQGLLGDERRRQGVPPGINCTVTQWCVLGLLAYAPSAGQRAVLI